MGAWEEVVQKTENTWQAFQKKYNEIEQRRLLIPRTASERLSLGGVGRPEDAQMAWDNSISRNVPQVAESIGEGYNRVQRAIADPSRSATEATAVALAEAGSVIPKVVGGAVDVGLDFVTPGTAVGEFVEDKAAKGFEYLLNTDTGQELEKAYEELPKADQDRLATVGSLAEAGLTAVGAGPVIRAIKRPKNEGFNDDGLMAASTNNYINDYYSPILKEAGEDRTIFEIISEDPRLAKAIMKAAPYVADAGLGSVKAITDPTKAVGAVKKAIGLSETGFGAIKEQFKNLLFSDRRALFATTGVTTAFQKEAAKLLGTAAKHEKLSAERAAKNKKIKAENVTREAEGKKPLPLLKAPPKIKEEQRAADKAGALGILQLHVAAQFGKVIPEGSALAKFRDTVFIKPYESYEPGRLTAWFKEASSTNNPRGKTKEINKERKKQGLKPLPLPNNKKTPISNKLAVAFESLIDEAHKITNHGKPVQIVMKRPQNQVSGNHYGDAFGTNNFNHQVIEDVFKDNGYKPFKTDAELQRVLQAAIDKRVNEYYGKALREDPEYQKIINARKDQASEYNKRRPAGQTKKVVKESWADFKKQFPDRVKDFKMSNKGTQPPNNASIIVKDGQIFLSSARPGSAIVEGGIRSTHHVNKSGRVHAVLSDEHDFLENIPVLNSPKAVGENSVIAVTPAMSRNYLKQVDETTGEAQRNADKVSDRVQASVSSPFTAREALEGMLTVKPTDAAKQAFATQQKGATAVAGAGGLFAALNTEKQEP